MSLPYANTQVDLVLLDQVLKGTGGPGHVQGSAVRRALAWAGYPILIYTNERRPAVLVACLTAGARGIIHKAEPIDALETAIIAVAGGEVVITQALVGLAELAERRGELPALTDRQRQILAARARGEPVQSIGQGLLARSAACYIDDGVRLRMDSRRFSGLGARSIIPRRRGVPCASRWRG